MSAVMAPAKLAKASPASSVTVRLARRPAIATRPPMETSAPAMPASGTASEVAPANEKAIMNEDAAAAACGAPNKAGSARGLRSSPCSAAPARPSVPPISSASSVRGRRMSRTMIPAGPSPSISPASAALGESPAGPTVSESTAKTTINAISPASRRQPLRRATSIASLRRPSYRLTACGPTGLRHDSAMTRSYLSKSAQFVLALLCALGAAADPAKADPPRRIVSFNICADQLVVALADPEQIAGLSPYATDPTLSAVAEEARAFRKVQWHAESVVPLNPDLVLVGPRDRSVTQRLLTALGFRVVGIDFVSTIAAAREQIRQVAALLGHPERGEKLIARLDVSRARLAAVPRPPASTALLIGHAGYTE